MPSSHSFVVGGSNAARRLACPASWRLEPTAPGGSSSSMAAQRGTALHELAERWVTTGELPDEPLAVEIDEGPVHLTAEDIAALHRAVASYRANIRTVHQPDIELVEQRVHYPDLEGAFGTADVIFRARRRPLAGIVDWKFGRYPVSAPENPQLLFYAVAARATHPAIFEGVEDVRLTIIQPETPSGISSWTTPIETLDAFHARLLDAARRGLAPDSPAVHGPHCHWALCQTVCPIKRAVASHIDAGLSHLAALLG